MLEFTLGKVIRKQRKKLLLTIEGLASIAGMDNAHVGRIERGQHNATLTTLKHISDALSLKLHELFNQGEFLDDYSIIERFVTHNFPYVRSDSPCVLFDHIGSVLLDRLTISDIERGALDASQTKFSLSIEPARKYIAYGVVAIYEYHTGCVIDTICDVSTDLHEVELLIKLLNDQQPSRIHLSEVVEDYINLRVMM